MIDVLSDVLRECRVEGSVFCRFEAGAGWAVAYPAGDIAAFHVITRGRCVLEYDAALERPGPAATPGAGRTRGLRQVTVEAGDFVLFAHGHAHVLRDADAPDRHVAPTAIEDLVDMDAAGPRGAALRVGHGDPASGYVCGAFRFADARTHPVLATLPPVLHVRAGALSPESTAPGGPLGPWLETLLDAATCEASSGRPGVGLVLARLSDVLFVHAIRAHLATAGGEAPGWLRALQDPPVGRALALMHAEPAREWTVASLAREVMMSRSRFAARFTQVVGRPPLDYLADWRMQRARGLLRGGAATVGEIAGRLGYRSEAAFSHAFRRRLGVAPGAYRRSHSAARSVAAATG